MKILVVDDEALARSRLVRLIERLDVADHIVEAANGEQALACCQREQPDLVFLDVRMPGTDGLAVAEHIGELEPAPAVIFCTAFDEYALEAIERRASAYLLKPVREEKLLQALEQAGQSNRLQIQARQNGNSEVNGIQREHVSCESNNGVELVPVSEVRCFIAEHKAVKAFTGERDHWIADSLKELEAEFDGQFLRVHRNALVAVQYIAGLKRDDEGQTLVLLEGIDAQPAISRRHLADVKQRVKNL